MDIKLLFYEAVLAIIIKFGVYIRFGQHARFAYLMERQLDFNVNLNTLSRL